MEKLDFQTESDGRFKLRGAMSYASVPSSLEESMRLFSQHPIIELDFSEVTSADSAGLALLIEWVGWEKRKHRELHFRNLPKQAVALARISDVEKMLPTD